MVRGASREALRILTLLFVAGIAYAQVQVYDGAGLGSAASQPVVFSGQQPISLEQQQQPVIFQQQQQPLRHHSYASEDPLVSFSQQQESALRHHSYESQDPFASLQHQHLHSYQAEDPLTSLQQPAGSFSLQQQPTVSLQQLQQPASAISALQQEPSLGVPALQGSASALNSQAVSLPLQQVPILAARPSALTVLPIQPSASLITQPSAQLQEQPEDVLEEEAAMAASAAMAETVMQSLGQALTQPAPRSARAGLQRQHPASSEGGGILEELAKLVESALFPEGLAPALAPEPAALPAVAGMPSIGLPQSLASRQRHSSQEPDDITVVKVEQSLTNPNIERVQVVNLKKKPSQSGGSSFQAQAAAPQVHPHLTSAAMRAQAQAAQPLPTAKNFQAAQMGAGQMQGRGFEAVPKAMGQSFKEMKHKKAGQAEQRSFEAEMARELYRLNNAPASEYEEIDAPGLAPAAGEKPMQAPAYKQGAAPARAPHSAPMATALQSNAIKAHTVPGVSFISNRNARRALRATSSGTHPAVIWQSHLLDVSPQQWNNLKSSYISGIAQGANVGKDQVIILGVTMGSSVTVNTQIIYYNDDSSAAGELKNALADQQSSPVYIPNFGNVQVSGVTQANVPIATPSPPPAPAAAASSYVAYTPASFSAPGPAAANTVAAAPGQQTAPGQQSVTPIVQTQTMTQDSSTDSSVAPVIRSQQVYKNNGLPVGAAVGVPLGAVALAAGLLYLAHLNRKRTARLIQEYTEPMIRKDADLSTPGSLASQAAPPPRRNTPSPKVSPTKVSPRPSASKV